MVNDLVHLSGIDPNVILYGRSVLKPNYPKAFLKRFRTVSEKNLNRVPNVVAFVFSIFYISTMTQVLTGSSEGDEGFLKLVLSFIERLGCIGRIKQDIL